MSANVAEYAFNLENRGPLETFSHYGQSGEPGNGPFVSIWLLVEGGAVAQARYQTHGCMWSMACASVTVTVIKGRPLQKALLLEANDISLILGGLPEGKWEMADRCVAALRKAIGE